MNKNLKFLLASVLICSLNACNSANQNQEQTSDQSQENIVTEATEAVEKDDDLSNEQKSSAQEIYKTLIKNKGNSKEELFITGYNSYPTEGDLNKDGFKDLVIMEIGDNPDMIDDKDNFPIDNNNVELRIYFGDAQGHYTLFKHYPYAVRETEYGQPGRFSITDKGALRFERALYYYKAADEFGHETHLFRFQDNDFYCIGMESEDYGRTGEGAKISINYLTRKRITTPIRSYEMVSKEAVTDTLSKEPLPTLADMRM